MQPIDRPRPSRRAAVTLAASFALGLACDRRLTVRRSGTQYQAELSIADEQAILNKIFVQATDDDVMPRVVHIDVQGTAIASGKALRERLSP